MFHLAPALYLSGKCSFSPQFNAYYMQVTVLLNKHFPLTLKAIAILTGETSGYVKTAVSITDPEGPLSRQTQQ